MRPSLTEGECRLLSEALGAPVRQHGYLAVAVERIIEARNAPVYALVDRWEKDPGVTVTRCRARLIDALVGAPLVSDHGGS